MLLTAERLRELLDYDRDTGVFTRKVRTSNRIKVGDVAGTVHEVKPGLFYSYISLGHRKYPAHRLAWLHVHGSWPECQIDHLDGDGLNNRLVNLREATQTQNNANTKRRIDNRSGAKGVSWAKVQQKWRAYITCNGRQRHLGYFSEVSAASAAYRAAANKCFAEYAKQD